MRTATGKTTNVIDLVQHELHMKRARLALSFLEMAGESSRHHLSEDTAVRLAVSALRWKP